MSFTAANPLVIRPFSLYRQSWSAEFGWSEREISLAMSILLWLAALMAPVAGYLAHRYPIRNTVRCFGAFYVLGLLSVTACRGSLLHFYLSFAFFGLSAPGISQFIYSQLLAEWFTLRLGTALAFLTSSIALSGIATPLITHTILTGFGWRACWLVWAIFAGCILFPLGSLLPAAPSQPHCVEPRGARRDYLRTMEFWTIAALGCLLDFGVNAILAHMSPLLAQIGVPAPRIAVCVSLFGAGNLIGRFVFGWLLDLWPATRVMYLSVASSTAALACFLSSRPAVAGLACALLGCSAASQFDLVPYLVRSSFGVVRMAEVTGFAVMPRAILSSAVVAAAGYSRDAYGSFTPMLLTLLASSFPAVGISMFWGALRRRREQSLAQLAATGQVEPQTGVTH